MITTRIKDLKNFIGQKVEIEGWVYNKRSSGKVRFLILRDGSGYLQCVGFVKDVSPEVFDLMDKVTLESSVKVEGIVREESRAIGGVELSLTNLTLYHLAEEYPISKKEHGTAFLMENRHLWLRSSRQVAILRIRSENEQSFRDYFYNNGFTLIDSPILTPAACEGTTTLFETEYFGEKAYLSQSGQLYLEPACMALGKVYCFGPTFRAEKSKTRRHLMEFWMLEPEVAFATLEDVMELAEDFLCYVVARVLDRSKEDLKRIERDTSLLEKIQKPFPRMRYSEAIEKLQKLGSDIKYGDDFGGDDETLLTQNEEKPIMVNRYPSKVKAFYMEPDPEDPELALCVDVLAPEGYGEIIGGSERISDHDLLLKRIQEHNLPVSAFQWYLDIRKYGTVKHGGFGIGLERTVAWICGLSHVRETIPYPRMLYKLYP
ncbi:MAG: asparagine--tRNA ligase [Thermoanaerobaculaceae bacterium]|nr:asparagine--tRNA ligase [Thermoanaerobaculaceae bacterium]